MPAQRTSPKGYEHARGLRKELTPFEQKLWSRLRKRQLHGIRFRRQHALGEFIVDFCAIKEKLIIELDGGQHKEQVEYDTDRTNYLEAQGYKVIRFWNSQVANEMDEVIRLILNALGITK